MMLFHTTTKGLCLLVVVFLQVNGQIYGQRPSSRHLVLRRRSGDLPTFTNDTDDSMNIGHDPYAKIMNRFAPSLVTDQKNVTHDDDGEGENDDF
jgi:hypothetical protein